MDRSSGSQVPGLLPSLEVLQEVLPVTAAHLRALAGLLAFLVPRIVTGTVIALGIGRSLVGVISSARIVSTHLRFDHTVEDHTQHIDPGKVQVVQQLPESTFRGNSGPD